jgi:hypothetical protein
MVMPTFRIWSSGVFRWLSDLPTSERKTLWNARVSQLLLFCLNAFGRRRKSVFMFEQCNSVLVSLYACFTENFSTFKTLLIMQLAFLKVKVTL